MRAGPVSDIAPSGSGARPRVDSLDLVRGFVMVLMALDHVRDFFTNARGFDPLDLTRTWPALFYTRWITHLCAPVFVFLAGTAAYLSGTRGKTRGELSRFLFTRGLWLVLMELTVVQIGWIFTIDTSFFFVQVIWAIGWCLIALSAFVYLPLSVITGLGLVMVATHNLFDGVTVADAGRWGVLWALLHVQTEVPIGGGRAIYVAYPLIPWIGVAAAGYGFGALYTGDAARRKRILLALGLGLSAGFVLLRALNVYGDPQPWSPQSSASFTVMSFLNTRKYPPSLLFLMMTLGPAILALAFLERPAGRLGRAFVVFGRVPFFYYVAHLYLAHVLAGVWAVWRYGLAALRQLGPMEAPPGWGHDLPVVYLVWLAVVAMLYPVCRWFAGLKQRRKDAWLSYL